MKNLHDIVVKPYVKLEVAYYNGSVLLDKYSVYGFTGETVPKKLLGSDKYLDTWNQIPKEFPADNKNLIIFKEGEDNMKYEVELVETKKNYKKEIAIATTALALIGAATLIRHIVKNKE